MLDAVQLPGAAVELADEMPDLAHIGRRGLIGALAHEDVEVDLGAIIAAKLFHRDEGGIDEHNLGLARVGIFLGLDAQFIENSVRGEIGYIVQIALVPGSLHAGVGHLGAAQEVFHVKAFRNVGLVGRGCLGLVVGKAGPGVLDAVALHGIRVIGLLLSVVAGRTIACCLGCGLGSTLLAQEENHAANDDEEQKNVHKAHAGEGAAAEQGANERACKKTAEHAAGKAAKKAEKPGTGTGVSEKERIREMDKIIFATGNAHKMVEIRMILKDLGVEILSQAEAGIHADVVEDGSTFEENALIKATRIREAAAVRPEYKNAVVLADDSGLEIDYLNKEPGIYSARYMGEDTSYDIKNQALLDRLEGVPDEKRTARFVCAIAAALPDGTTEVVRGTMEGIIGHEIAGENGFGYDPIFFLPEYGCTSAELSPEKKNELSHRGEGLRKMREILERRKGL